MEQSPSWEANRSSNSHESPAVYGTWRFITTFTSNRHLSLSWARAVKSIPLHLTSWRSILMLSSYLCLVLFSGLLPSSLPTKSLYVPLLSPIHSTCPTHLILPASIIQMVFGEGYRAKMSSLCSLLHSPVTSSLGPDIFLSSRRQQTRGGPLLWGVEEMLTSPHHKSLTVLQLLTGPPTRTDPLVQHKQWKKELCDYLLVGDAEIPIKTSCFFVVIV